MSRKKIERIAAIISIASFGGSILVGGIQAIVTAMNQSQETSQTASVDVKSSKRLRNSQLNLQAKEYKIVLKQEPDNQVALKGLVEARIQMQNPKTAIQPLEKLIELNSSNQEYKNLLAQLTQQDKKSDR
ncbi:tetratricopeptide repeat protein [Chroococcidiopsis sp. FACHB-1243]|uniref:tetratricopeptide repeat protein n=1 Tax=Chroococcidiopsis sp. [FACHB-1243] TaxID=2692781 RepID=UPI00177BC3F3|nr:tetratricopeptide repeat protein [Chroococcidiopsis sp. [FACHB-1243]]MBD2307504.1 tetratricopeptide repeat protein [Chroococcidiopsis sp. [FACHB-1243]]